MTTTNATHASVADARSKRATKSAFSSYYVDMLDIYLPILVLAPAIGYFVSPDLTPTWTAVASATIFIGTLLGRPFGAGIFGPLADSLGRKRVAVITMAGSGLTTLTMGLILGYEEWGLIGLVIFIALRFVNGVWIGGQYTAANPLAMEYAPKRKRGLYAAAINCAFPIAYITAALAVMLLLSSMSSNGLDSAYVQWGWRIPFICLGVMELCLALYYVYRVDESDVWKTQQADAKHTKTSPIKSLLSTNGRKTFIQVFILMSGLWLALQSVAAILPGVLKNSVELTATSVTFTLITSYAVLIGANLTAGAISQRFGRRPTLMVQGIGIATVATLLYFLLISSGAAFSIPVVIVLVTLIVCLVDSPFALSISYINERFQVSERASGYGLSYSASVILPSFYAYYQLGLSTFMPFDYTVLVLIVIGGSLITVGAAMGPETKDVDFADS